MNPCFDENLEEWTYVDGYDNYMVSDMGRVWNEKYKRYIKYIFNAHGYGTVQLYKQNIKKVYLVHRLVALTFLDNVEQKKIVDHINNDRTDNRLCNLRYASVQENSRNSAVGKNNTSGFKGVYFDKVRNCLLYTSDLPTT